MFGEHIKPFNAWYFKLRDRGWISGLYMRGKKLIKFITRHTRVHYFYVTFSSLPLPKIANCRFGSYLLTFNCLLSVRHALGEMVLSDEWDDLRTDRDNANAMKDTVLDNYFWS